MVFNSWTSLEEKCPINISRLVRYSKSFDSKVGLRITIRDLNKAKRRLIEARGELDAMITSLMQVLYDRKILRTHTDKILYGWLVDNLGRCLKRVDEKEEQWLIKYDEVGYANNLVGISRLSAYAKLMKTVSNSVIYESLFRANYEYHHLIENEKLKKEPRTYLYILFQILNVTLSVSGALTREDKGLNRKGTVMNFPTSYQSLMGNAGQNLIKKGYEQETGQKIDDGLEKDLKSLDENFEGELEDDMD